MCVLRMIHSAKHNASITENLFELILSAKEKEEEVEPFALLLSATLMFVDYKKLQTFGSMWARAVRVNDSHTPEPYNNIK